MREAPSLTLIKQLQKEGANIAAFDPVAKKNAQKLISNVEFVDEQYEVLKDADCLILITELDEYKNYSFRPMPNQQYSGGQNIRVLCRTTASSQGTDPGHLVVPNINKNRGPQ